MIGGVSTSVISLLCSLSSNWFHIFHGVTALMLLLFLLSFSDLLSRPVGPVSCPIFSSADVLFSVRSLISLGMVWFLISLGMVLCCLNFPFTWFLFVVYFCSRHSLCSSLFLFVLFLTGLWVHVFFLSFGRTPFFLSG